MMTLADVVQFGNFRGLVSIADNSTTMALHD